MCAYWPETTDNSPLATFSPAALTVPSMQAMLPASVSFVVSMRKTVPGATGLKNLKRLTAASSADFITASREAAPIITAAVCATASINNTPGKMGREGKCPAKTGFPPSTLSHATQ